MCTCDPISCRVQYKEAFELGIREFNNGQFFECHDTFEEIWHDLRGEKRRFVQGLIHSAVAVFHAGRENYRGAESQLMKALDKLGPYESPCVGVDLDGLRSDLNLLLDSIRNGMDAGAPHLDRSLIPTIRYSYDPVGMTALE